VGGDAWLGSLDGGEDDGERQADRRYEGERDVRGEVGELCGSGAERKEAGARGKNRAEEAEPRAVKPREPKFLRTKFVLHFILFRSREASRHPSFVPAMLALSPTISRPPLIGPIFLLLLLLLRSLPAASYMCARACDDASNRPGGGHGNCLWPVTSRMAS
jgi:hypothetical protein